LGPALVAGTFAFGACVLTEATLAFLGLGVAPPEPSWGSLIGETGSLVHWWSMVFPGLCLCLCVAASNAIGEALGDALDPRGEGGRP
jgi:peptide/nickel transport system permease protein